MTTLKIEDDTVEDLPPSAKLVYLILQETGPCTQAEVIDRTTLSGRTVRYAVDRLVNADVVTKRPYLGDARQSLYELSETAKNR